MAKTTSISLGDHFNDFVEQQVASGRYGSASEVVRAGLRSLEQLETRHQALQKAISAGLESGIAEDFDMDALQKELDAEA
ncbi:type II toxin-antitoxin system ParD family antitoxin [Denitrobaculum tricleocarpae]|uniref:Type II toxin-antitoxin system ParD family antitoxin n=1 Tax=Denitrobaculum tricleocarpae TaxID=2591009 RepID=A0A545T802_9PROT|nr:type II toxin-antitoxin system ParD family antitoxin [Denitrobaculum tricleocarpae]TQV73366.1 type II toxin-antitoxin system ParD family antitoxin [Denitrobaculum tricleocarpae]